MLAGDDYSSISTTYEYILELSHNYKHTNDKNMDRIKIFFKGQKHVLSKYLT